MIKNMHIQKEMYMYMFLKELVSLCRVIVVHSTECATNAHFIIVA